MNNHLSVDWRHAGMPSTRQTLHSQSIQLPLSSESISTTQPQLAITSIMLQAVQASTTSKSKLRYIGNNHMDFNATNRIYLLATAYIFYEFQSDIVLTNSLA